MINIPEFWPVTQNSKKVQIGGTFVAIKGKKDGVEFVKEALQNGAKRIVIEKEVKLNSEVEILIQQKKAEVVKVENSRKVLADLCSRAYNKPQDKLKIIGITGTKGKTTTTYLVHHILKQSEFKTAMLSGVKNYILDQEFNSELTTPHADYLYAFLDACVKSGVEYLVMEASAQGFSLHRTDNILFSGAIFTNLSQEHAEFYKTQQDYFNAKKKMFGQLLDSSKVVVNIDDDYGEEIIKKHPKFTSVSLESNADYQIKNIKTGFNGLCFDLNNFNIQSSLIGRFNSYNIADAFVLAKELGLSISDILKALSNFSGVPGRMECFKLKNGSLGVIDYAHTPSSYQEVLSTLKNLTKDLIVVFGCGGERDSSKRSIMGKIAAKYADKIILTNDNPRSEDPNKIIKDITSEFTHDDIKKVFIELNRELAITKAYHLSQKGSIFAVLGKGPDEYQIIGQDKFFFSDKQVLTSKLNL